MAVGKIGKAYFFGLPGNPTAAQVTFYAIVSIALALLSGQKDPKLVYALAAAKGKFKKNVGYTDFQRGLLTMEDGRVTVTPAGSQKTGALKSMIKATVSFTWLIIRLHPLTENLSLSFLFGEPVRPSLS